MGPLHIHLSPEQGIFWELTKFRKHDLKRKVDHEGRALEEKEEDNRTDRGGIKKF